MEQLLMEQAGLVPQRAAPSGVPRSVRNNNGGNLRWDGKSQWQGMTGVDPDGFVQFDTPESGDRALQINIANQAKLHGINTVRAAIAKYAPAADGNDTGAYVAHVAQQLGVDPDQPVDFADPRISATVANIIKPVEGGGGMQGTGGAAPAGAPDEMEALLAAQANSDAAPASAPVQGPASAPEASPTAPAEGWGSYLLHGGEDALIGGGKGVLDTVGTAGWLGDKAAGLVGIDLGAQAQADRLQDFLTSKQNDPNGWGSTLGRLGGNVVGAGGAAGLATKAIPALRVAGETGALARALKMAGQGAIGGAAVSGGHDVALNAAGGAVGGAAIDAAVNKVALPAALKAISAAQSSRLAQALRRELPAAADEATAVAGPAEAPTIARGSETAVDPKLPFADGMGPNGVLRVNIEGGYRPLPTKAPAAEPERVRSSEQDRLAQALHDQDFSDTDFGVLSPDKAERINTIREGLGQDILRDGRLVVPANVVKKLHNERVLKDGATPDEVADVLYSVFHASKSQAASTRYPHIQALINAREKLSNIGFISRNPATGDTVVKSGYPRDTARLADALRGKGKAGGTRDTPSSVAAEPQSPQTTISADQPSASTISPEAESSKLSDEQALIAALGSRGARRGLGKITDLPPAVQATYDDLIRKGVDPAQALREADMRGIGAEPTYAMVTRDRAAQGALREGAKMDTDDGRALADALSRANAAPHRAAQAMVQRYGGIPNQGEAAEAAARVLAADETAMQRGVSQRYAEAEKAEGPAKVEPGDLYAFLGDPYRAGAINRNAQTLVGGLRKRLDLFTGNKGDPKQKLRPLNAHSLEHLRKAAIDAYDEVGSPELRGIIHDWTNLIDDHLSSLGDIGPTYAKARAAHAKYAGLYKDPEGLAALIRRNDRGDFLNADRWRQAEDKLIGGGKNDRNAAQVIKRLRELPDGSTAIARLKATVIQHAYERATRSATDETGNSVFNGKMFSDAISSRLGEARMNALFDKGEIAEIASLARAATAINEPVPGTLNTSNTASALARIQAEMKEKPQKGVMEMVGHGIATAVHPGVGNVAVHFGSKAAEGLRKAAQERAMAQAVQQELDPSLGRAGTKKLAEQLRRHQRGGAVSARITPAASSAATAAALRQLQGRN